MEDYRQIDIYKGTGANPHFAEVVVKDFAVLEAPTRVTRGLSEEAGIQADSRVF